MGYFPHNRNTKGGKMEQLLNEIEEYAQNKNVHPSTILRYSVNATWSIWKKWKSGESSCSFKTAKKIRKYMAEN